MFNKENTKKILLIFLISRFPIIIISLYQYFTKGNISILELYDSSNYLTIAGQGYTEALLYAFFPLYPLLIKIFYLLIPSYVFGGFIISNGTFLLSLFILNYLLKNNKNKLIYLLIYTFSPILIFNSIIYTESLYLLITLLAFYFYKKDKLYLSAVFAGLSFLTRNTGILLMIAMGIDLLIRLIKKDKKISLKKIIIFTLIASSIGVLYPLYLYFKTGDLFYFITVQDLYWYRKNCLIFIAFIDDIKMVVKQVNITLLLIFIENWISYIFAIILSIKIFKKEKLLSLYTLLSLLIFSVSFRNTKNWTGSLATSSMFRYIWGLFPLYLVLLSKQKEKYNTIIVIVIIVISIINYWLFYLGNFIG